RLQEKAKALEKREKSIRPRRPAAQLTRKARRLAGDRPCFPIVIYNAACSGSHVQLQPGVERERGPAATRNTARVVEFVTSFRGPGMTRHIPSRTEPDLRSLRL